jgi:hypothetical protein
MSENMKLFGKKLEHPAHARLPGLFDSQEVRAPEKIRGKGSNALTPNERETSAAFRTTLADFQEQPGKTMRSVAIEEEVNV